MITQNEEQITTVGSTLDADVTVVVQQHANATLETIQLLCEGVVQKANEAIGYPTLLSPDQEKQLKNPKTVGQQLSRHEVTIEGQRYTLSLYREHNSIGQFFSVVILPVSA